MIASHLIHAESLYGAILPLQYDANNLPVHDATAAFCVCCCCLTPDTVVCLASSPSDHSRCPLACIHTLSQQCAPSIVLEYECRAFQKGDCTGSHFLIAFTSIMQEHPRRRPNVAECRRSRHYDGGTLAMNRFASQDNKPSLLC